MGFNAVAAYEACSINKEFIEKVYFDAKAISSTVACSEGHRVNQLLSRLTGLVDIPLPKVSIHLVPESDNAAYDNGTLITIPVKFYSMSAIENSEKIYKSTSDLDAIVLHEYGHAILASYLVEHWDSFSIYRKFGLEISKLKQELFLEDNLEKKAYLKDLEKEFMIPRSMRTFSSKITPFQEFFADVLSVSILEDKKAIYNAIVENESEEPRYVYRRFDKTYKEDGNKKPDSHGHFYKARELIGAKYWDQMLKDKNIFFKNLLEATRKELAFSFHMSSFMNDPISDNEYFIETLVEHLGNSGD